MGASRGSLPFCILVLLLAWATTPSLAAFEFSNGRNDGENKGERILSFGEDRYEQGGLDDGGGGGGRETSFKFCKRSEEDGSVLSCICDNKDKVLELSADGDVVSDLSFLLANDDGHDGDVEVLETLFCSVNVTSDFFNALAGVRGFSRLAGFGVYGALKLALAPGAFASPIAAPSSVRLAMIGSPVLLAAGVFGPAVANVTLEGVKLEQFSSDSFVGLPASARLSITNCTLAAASFKPWHYSPGAGKHHGPLKVASVTFSDLTMNGPGHTFLDLEVKELAFRRCVLNLYTSVSIRAAASGEAAFDDTDLKLLAADAISVSARELSFDRSRFLEPKQRALSALTAADGDSVLRMRDVVLRDPSKGVLLLDSSFARVDLNNVSVSEICLCDQVRYLLSDVGELGFRFGPDVGPEFRADLESKLTNATFCLTESGERIRPEDACAEPGSPRVDLATGWVLAALVLGALAVFVFGGVFLYKWHRVVQMKYRIVRNMKVIDQPVVERVTNVKERLVSFDKNVKVFDRPPSVFYIASESSDAEMSSMQQPDLVRSVSRRATVFRTQALRPDSVDEEPAGFARGMIKEEEEEVDAKNVGGNDLEALDAIQRQTLEMIQEMDGEETWTESVRFTPLPATTATAEAVVHQAEDFVSVSLDK